MAEVKYERNKLNASQVELLGLIYKYRFGTRKILGESLGINDGSSLHERLRVLEKHGYLGKRQDIRSKAINKPAVYYLTSKGVKALQAQPGREHIGERALRLSYQNKTTVSNGFVAHTLSIFEYTLWLKHYYPALKVFTEREMERYSYFPEKLPDAFLSLANGKLEQPRRFFLDIVRDRAPRRALDIKLTTYNEFFDEGGWDETDSPIPTILLVCEWAPDERKIQRHLLGLLNRLGSELRVLTTTAQALESNTTTNLIWSDVNDTDDLIALDQ